LWEDKAFGRLAMAERVLFIALFSNADDEGRILADPANLRALAFRYDDFSLAEVRAMRDHIVATMPNVVLYEAQGDEYIWLRSWAKRQHPKYPQPSRLPPPPPDSDTIPATLPQTSERFGETLPEPSPEPAEGLAERSSVGWDGMGRDRSGEGSLVHPLSRANDADPPAPPPFYPDFETWWAVYPRKQGKQAAYARYVARRRAGLSAEALLAAAQHMAAAGREPPYVPLPKTFLGPDVTEWVAGIPASETVPRRYRSRDAPRLTLDERNALVFRQRDAKGGPVDEPL